MVLCMDQRLVPSLKKLREEIDHLAPGRDRGADGDIGDRAHQQSTSAHNPDDTPGVRVPREDADHEPEIHAIDIDASGPWPDGRDLNWIVEVIRGRHLRGFDNRLQNIIWRDRIASRSWGWSWQNKLIGHYDHAHFECTSDPRAEADTREWGLVAFRDQEDEMDLNDRVKLTEWTRKTVGGLYADAETVSVETALNLLLGFTAKASRIDTPAIVTGVLTGLEPRVIADAIPHAIAIEVINHLRDRLNVAPQ